VVFKIINICEAIILTYAKYLDKNIIAKNNEK